MSVYQEPAFPSTETNEGHFNPGMTLRDHFAGMALASGLAGSWRDSDYRPLDGLSLIENTARCAYEYADAMIKAREAK